MRNFPVDRGSTEDQERWRTELSAAEEAENFPPGGSLILAESPAHALQIVHELRAKGHRALVRGVYVRTSAAFTSARSPSHKGQRK
jgi:hypothetical protein